MIRVKTERRVSCEYTLNMHSTLHTCTVPRTWKWTKYHLLHSLAQIIILKNGNIKDLYFSFNVVINSSLLSITPYKFISSDKRPAFRWITNSGQNHICVFAFCCSATKVSARSNKNFMNIFPSNNFINRYLKFQSITNAFVISTSTHFMRQGLYSTSNYGCLDSNTRSALDLHQDFTNNSCCRVWRVNAQLRCLHLICSEYPYNVL